MAAFVFAQTLEACGGERAALAHSEVADGDTGSEATEHSSSDSASADSAADAENDSGAETGLLFKGTTYGIFTGEGMVGMAGNVHTVPEIVGDAEGPCGREAVDHRG